MAIIFSGLEMIKIAILLEEEGADFYQKGAENTTGEVREFLLSAAAQELSHKDIFTKLYDEMSLGKEKDTEYLFDDEVARYLGRLTENKVFNKDENLNAFKNLNVAVKSSLDRELLTVKVYTELYKGVKEESAKEIMNKIINEEKQHAAFFENLLRAL